MASAEREDELSVSCALGGEIEANGGEFKSMSSCGVCAFTNKSRYLMFFFNLCCNVCLEAGDVAAGVFGGG